MRKGIKTISPCAITFAPSKTNHNVCTKQEKKESSAPISRVLSPPSQKKTTVSAIYLVYESPHSSSILPSIVTKVGRTILKQWFTRTCGLQMTQPTDHPVAGGLLHHLLTLTLLSAGGCFLLPYPTVTNSFYFRKWSVLCRPDFPLAKRTSGRPERCFLTAKLINLNEKQRIQTFFYCA